MSDLAFRGELDGGLRLLEQMCRAGVPVSAGSFDVLLHAAARRGDRRRSLRAYRMMRRARIVPGALTLNGLLRSAARDRTLDSSSRASRAAEWLRRARDDGGRWHGAPPDGVSYNTVMAAACEARRRPEVEELFAQLNASRPELRPDLISHNTLLRARMLDGDFARGLALLEQMESGCGDAPRPRTDTYNTALTALARAGWPVAVGAASLAEGVPHGDRLLSSLVAAMERVGAAPDEYTVTTLLLAQDGIDAVNEVWAWARRLGVRRTPAVWMHYIGAHLRHGQPRRVPALLERMARDGCPLDIRAHNQYLKACLACGDEAAALTHYALLVTAAGAASTAEAAASAAPADAPAPRVPPPAAAAAASAAAVAVGKARSAATALAAAAAPAGSAAASPTIGSRPQGLSSRAQGLAPPAALIAGRLPHPEPYTDALAMRAALGGIGHTSAVLRRDQAAKSAPAPPPASGAASVLALVRECGRARRVDQALLTAVLSKRDGVRLGRAGLDAFAEGWADSKAERGIVGEPALEAAYDRLLRIECCPDSLGLPASGVDRIKVSWR